MDQEQYEYKQVKKTGLNDSVADAEMAQLRAENWELFKEEPLLSFDGTSHELLAGAATYIFRRKF
jgi:hypothetical protein